MTNHDLAMKALTRYQAVLTRSEVESLAAYASLEAANEKPAPHERGMCAEARAVLGISPSPTVPVWER